MTDHSSNLEMSVFQKYLIWMILARLLGLLVYIVLLFFIISK